MTNSLNFELWRCFKQFYFDYIKLKIWSKQAKDAIKVTPKQQEKSPQWSIKVNPSKYDTLHLHMKSLKLEIIKMVTNLGYFISCGITLCSIDQSNPISWWGYFDRPITQFTSKGYFYFKNKFQEVTEKNIHVLYTEMQGYFIKFKYWNLKKTLKINQSNPVSR